EAARGRSSSSSSSTGNHLKYSRPENDQLFSHNVAVVLSVMMAPRWICYSGVVLVLLLLDVAWAVVHVDDGVAGNIEWRSQATDSYRQRLSCPDECTCHHLRHVECHAQNPYDLPPQLDNSTSFLALNGYSYIPTQLLAKLLHLTHLTISGSNIGNLKLFPQLPKLEVLDVSNNGISTLGSGDLQSIAPKLIQFNACDNKISDVTITDFQGLENLEVLELCNNPLDISNDRFLQGLTSLRHLDLSNTKYSHLPSSLFQDTPELQYLNISSAALVNLPEITGQKIRVLDLSHNSIQKLPYGFISKAPHLKVLILSHNPIQEIQKGVLKGARALESLHLSSTSIEVLNGNIFSDCSLLISLYLDYNENLHHIAAGAFTNLPKLQILDLSFTPKLIELQEPVFSSNMALEQINLEHSGLTVFPSSILKLENVEILLAETSIHCDCYHFWFPDLMNYTNIKIKNNDTIKCTDGNYLTLYQLTELILNLNCAAPVAITESKQWYKTAEGESALLDCNVTANPPHSTVWIVPSSQVFQYNGNSTLSQNWVNSRIRNAMESSEEEESNKEVLETGQLLVCNFQYKDAGRYKCFAHNSVGNTSVIAYMGVDEADFRRMYYESLAIGGSCALLFLLITLAVQLVHYLMDWFGWKCCCCRDHLTPRARKVKRLMEGVELYKSQQLERLRENYNGQVLNIKDSCYGQLDRLRESYSGQIQNLRDIRDYSSNQLGGMKDQYIDQCTKIGEYSMCQVNRVRENYIFQRHRVRKFSAHQLIKMKESYKYQAKTLSKVLENMPDFYLQNCRTADTSSEDLEFDDPLKGIDMYYKVDFFDTMSHGSDYYTPNSTLTRNSKKKQAPGNTNTNDYTLPSIPQLWLQREMESRSSGGSKTHSRSLSFTVTPTQKSPELAKVHKRSLSASQTGSQNRLMPPNRITLQEENSDSELTSPMLTPPSGPATPIHQASGGLKIPADQLLEEGSATLIHQISLQQSEPATDSAQNVIESKQGNELENVLNQQCLEDNSGENESGDYLNNCDNDSNSVSERDTLLELVLENSISRSPSRERTNSGGSSPSSYETAS
ncbi:unnamed protein product, partial [Meganyctiphanes norvegica]